MNCWNYMNNGGGLFMPWSTRGQDETVLPPPRRFCSWWWLHVCLLGLWCENYRTDFAIWAVFFVFFLTIVKIPLVMSLWAADERIRSDRLKKVVFLEPFNWSIWRITAVQQRSRLTRSSAWLHYNSAIVEKFHFSASWNELNKMTTVIYTISFLLRSTETNINHLSEKRSAAVNRKLRSDCTGLVCLFSYLGPHVSRVNFPAEVVIKCLSQSLPGQLAALCSLPG